MAANYWEGSPLCKSLAKHMTQFTEDVHKRRRSNHVNDTENLGMSCQLLTMLFIMCCRSNYVTFPKLARSHRSGSCWNMHWTMLVGSICIASDGATVIEQWWSTTVRPRLSGHIGTSAYPDKWFGRIWEICLNTASSVGLNTSDNVFTHCYSICNKLSSI